MTETTREYDHAMNLVDAEYENLVFMNKDDFHYWLAEFAECRGISRTDTDTLYDNTFPV